MTLKGWGNPPPHPGGGGGNQIFQNLTSNLVQYFISDKSMKKKFFKKIIVSVWGEVLFYQMSISF